MILIFICFFHIKMDIPKLIEIDSSKLNDDEYNKVVNIYLKQEINKLKENFNKLEEKNDLLKESDELLREKNRNEIKKNNYDILTGKTNAKKIKYRYEDENGNIFTGEETFNRFFNKHFNKKKDDYDFNNQRKMEEMIKQIEESNCMKEVDIYVDNLKIKI